MNRTGGQDIGHNSTSTEYKIGLEGQQWFVCVMGNQQKQGVHFQLVN
jgi:hypothetical protein